MVYGIRPSCAWMLVVSAMIAKEFLCTKAQQFLPVFEDELTVGWTDYSSNADINYNDPTQPSSGSTAITAWMNINAMMLLMRRVPIQNMGKGSFVSFKVMALTESVASEGRLRIGLGDGLRDLGVLPLNEYVYRTFDLNLGYLEEILFMIKAEVAGGFRIDELQLHTQPEWKGALPGIPLPTPSTDGGLLKFDKNSQQLSILPLGDSITQGQGVEGGGYRTPLFEMMSTAGYSLDFMGSRTDNSEGLVEKQHEGHPGWSTNVLLESLEWVLPDWKAAPNPLMVLLTIGSNDFLLNNHNPVGTTIHDMHARVAEIVRNIAERRPNTHIVVNTVPPLWLDPLIKYNTLWFNEGLEDMVAALRDEMVSVSFSPAGGSLTRDDLYDGIHPTREAYVKMAAILTETIINSIYVIQNPPSPPPPAPLVGDEACCRYE